MTESKSKAVWYSVPWDLVKDTAPQRFECKTTCILTDESWRSFIAEECAQDYHDNHDGWEASWPLTIFLYDGEFGAEVARFIVERESRPDFSAIELTL